jgi:carboxyl-terminal processing protease
MTVLQLHRERSERVNPSSEANTMNRAFSAAPRRPWGRLVVLLAAVAAPLVTASADEPPAAAAAPAAAVPKPGPNDRAIALAVRNFLEREHYLGQPIDDTVARRWFKSFLEALDPMKVYFLQGDVDAFMQKRESLDDLVKRGDVSFAYEVLARFLQRVDSRLPLIERLIQTPQDFAKEESIVIDRDATSWARTEAEAEDLWRKRIKFDLLVQKM